MGFDVGVVAAALVVFGVEPLLLYRRGAVEPDAAELVERARENARARRGDDANAVELWGI